MKKLRMSLSKIEVTTVLIPKIYALPTNWSLDELYDPRVKFDDKIFEVIFCV